MSDSIKAREAQAKLCRDTQSPHFAPHSGVCFSCGRDIYDGDRGYSVEYAETYHVTGCPYCCRSYCD